MWLIRGGVLRIWVERAGRAGVPFFSKAVMRKGLARRPTEEEARGGHHLHVLRRVDRWGVRHAQVRQEHIACATGHFDDRYAWLMEVSAALEVFEPL